ncbi:MAG: AAA family ATPase [Pseudomonadota bacterium]
MHIAVTGTHGVGKTTLVEDLAESGRSFDLVPEPFLIFQDDDAFVDGPNTQDLEVQLNQSCDLILDLSNEKSLVFDRCPLDFIAYLDVVSDAEGFDWTPSDEQLNRIEQAMEALDLVVFVPLLSDDEIESPNEYPQLRRRVDTRLKTILDDDDLGFFENDLRLLEICGPRDRRVANVLAELARKA